MRPIDWVYSKGTTVISFTSETFSKIKSAVAISATKINFTKDDLHQAWEGFSRPFDRSIYRVLKRSPQTKGILKQSISANILYMGSILIYEGLVKRCMRSLVPEVQNSYTENMMDILAYWYFLRTSIRMFADNSIYNSCLAQVAGGENPNKEFFPKCTHSQTAVIFTNLSSPMYQLAKEFIPPYIGWLLLPKIYGDLLLEFNMDAMCREERNELLHRNNAYSFGFGLSFMGANWLIKMGIVQLSGANSLFVSDALYCALFQYYIVLSRLINKTLPGQAGRDYFYVLHAVSNVLSGLLGDFIKSCFFSKEFTVNGLIDRKNRILESKQGKFLMDVFLERDLQDRYRFAKRPPAQLFLDLKGDGIQATLEDLISKRKTYLFHESISLMNVYPILHRIRLPRIFLTVKDETFIRILLSEKLEGIPEAINDFITEVRNKETGKKIYDKKILQAISKELSLAQEVTCQDDASIEEELLNKNWVITNDSLKSGESKLIIEDFDEEKKIQTIPNDSSPSAEDNLLDLQSDEILDDWYEISPEAISNLQQYSLFAESGSKFSKADGKQLALRYK